MTRHSPIVSLSALLLLASCMADVPAALDDGEHDHSTDKAGAVYGIEEASYEAAAIVEFASTATKAALVAIGISEHAATATIAKQPYATLLVLDEAAYTGSLYFATLLQYVQDNNLVGSCGDGTVQPLVETCDDALCAPCTAIDPNENLSRLVKSFDLPNGPMKLLELEAGGFIVSGTAYDAGTYRLGSKTAHLEQNGHWIARFTNAGVVKYFRALDLEPGYLGRWTWLQGARVWTQLGSTIVEISNTTGSMVSRLENENWYPQAVQVNDDSTGLFNEFGLLEWRDLDSAEVLSGGSSACESLDTPQYYKGEVWCIGEGREIYRHRNADANIAQSEPIGIRVRDVASKRRFRKTSQGFMAATEAAAFGDRGYRQVAFFKAPSSPLPGNFITTFVASMRTNNAECLVDGEEVKKWGIEVCRAREDLDLEGIPTQFWELSAFSAGKSKSIAKWITTDESELSYPVDMIAGKTVVAVITWKSQLLLFKLPTSLE